MSSLPKADVCSVASGDWTAAIHASKNVIQIRFIGAQYVWIGASGSSSTAIMLVLNRAGLLVATVSHRYLEPCCRVGTYHQP